MTEYDVKSGTGIPIPGLNVTQTIGNGPELRLISTCDLMHSQFPIEGSLYRQYSQTSEGTPNCKQNEFN